MALTASKITSSKIIGRKITAVPVYRGRWNPLSVAPVLWLDPADKSTLFQDSAGTTPVAADGDPVGLWMDKSGNGNHFSQSTTASKPTYRESGDLSWIEFDGVDDVLEMSGALVGTEQVTAVAGAMYSTGGYVLNQNSGAFSSYRLYNSGTADIFRSTGDTGGATASAGASLPVTDVYTGMGDTGNDICTLRVGGIQQNSDASGQGGGAYEGANNSAVGAQSTGASYLDGNVYSVIVCDRILSPSEIASAEKFTAQRTGVTL